MVHFPPKPFHLDPFVIPPHMTTHDVIGRYVRRVVQESFATLEAASAFVYWGLVYLAANPTVQSKCQDEIDQVGHKLGHIGPNRTNPRPIQMRFHYILSQGCQS